MIKRCVREKLWVIKGKNILNIKYKILYLNFNYWTFIETNSKK